MRLKNKVAIITGGSRGLGKATCIKLAREGAKVVVNYAKDADSGEFTNAANDVVHEIISNSSEAIAYEADVTDKNAVDNMIDFTVKKFGHVDILVANAGICPFKEFLEIDEALFRIKNGTFGTCQSCGEPVGEKRLGVKPEAPLCIKCQNGAEGKR
jgi:NAD(P)-dependent dehydrogenase (short-subunit alcohol dehydrogenase family)